MYSSIRTNIFLSHTPLQNFISLKVAQQFFSSEDFKNLLVTSIPTSDIKFFDSHVLIDKNSFVHKTINTFRAKKKIEGILKKQRASIFISHTSPLLDNYFFYVFPLEKYDVDLNFYYEGILSFYEYREPYDPKKHLSRKLFGLLCGMGYQRNPVIFPAYDSKVHTIYSILPKFTLGPKEKIKEISLLQERYAANTSNILIMGGKPTLLENEEVIQLYREMIKQIMMYTGELKIYFKGHHADKTNNFDIANNHGISVEDITQSNPVEDVIEQYRPFAVFSYPSSGLINLKKMYHNNIEIYSFYKKSKEQDLSKIWPIFKELGIHVKLL